MKRQHSLLCFSPRGRQRFKQSLKTACKRARILLLLKPALLPSCRAAAREQRSPWLPGGSPEVGAYLREDVGALLQQRHRRVADARRQLDSQELFFESGVFLQRVGQGHRRAPVRERVRGKEAPAEQLASRDGVTCSYHSGREVQGRLKQARTPAKLRHQPIRKSEKL